MRPAETNDYNVAGQLFPQLAGFEDDAARMDGIDIRLERHLQSSRVSACARRCRL